MTEWSINLMLNISATSFALNACMRAYDANGMPHKIFKRRHGIEFVLGIAVVLLQIWR